MKRTLLSALLLLAAIGAHANLITNGDFESGATGWTGVTGYNFIAGGGNPGSALVLNDYPGPVPSASQVISGLVLGVTYDITLDAKTYYNCCNSSTTPGAGVAIDGHQFDFLVVNSQRWMEYSFSFTYAGINSTLVLSSQRNGTDSDAEFDNVTLSPANTVPEPASLALMGLGLAVLSFTRKRKTD